MNRRAVSLFALIAALHVLGLSLACGSRHAGYLLSAALSATAVWGTVFSLAGGSQGVAVAGIVLVMGAQVVAYRVWKSELPGFWLPLMQFWAMQYLVGQVVRQTVSWCRYRRRPQ